MIVITYENTGNSVGIVLNGGIHGLLHKLYKHFCKAGNNISRDIVVLEIISSKSKWDLVGGGFCEIPFATRLITMRTF